MSRRTGLAFASVVVFGVLGVAALTGPLGALTQDLTNLHVTDLSGVGTGASRAAASPLVAASADRSPPPPQLGLAELSPTTEDTLWPVPTFKDGCQPQKTPGSNPADNADAQGCDPDIFQAQPRPTDWRAALDIAGAATLVALVGGATVGGWLLLSRRRAGKDRRADQIRRWQIGTKALDDIASAVMTFEMDPQSVLSTRPLLADVDEPATAAFYSAYSAAQALRTPVIPSDEDAITAFVAAASSAQRAFEAADANARSKAQRGDRAQSAVCPSS